MNHEIYVGLGDLCEKSAIVFALYAATGSVRAHYPAYSRAILGATFGSAILLTMTFAVPLGGGVVADLRGALLFSAMVFGGKTVGFVSLAIAETYRTYLGGSGVYAGLAGNAMASAVGFLTLKYLGAPFNRPPEQKLIMTLTGAVGVMITTNLAYIFILPWSFAWAVWQKSAAAISIANFLTTAVLVGLMETARALRISHTRLAEVAGQLSSTVRAARVGGWRYDVHRELFQFDTACEALLGYKRGTLAQVPRDQAMSITDPAIADQRRAALDAVILGPSAFVELETKLKRTTGSDIIIREALSVLETDRIGRPTILQGVMVDVTEVAQAREQIQASAERFELIVQAAPDGILLIDSDLKIISINPAAEKLFGYSQAALTGKPINVLLPDAARSAHSTDATRFLNDRRASWKPMANLRTVTGIDIHGKEVPVLITISRSLQDGKPIGIAIIRDMREVLNNRAFIESLNKTLERKLVEAESANIAKSRFLAAMSHELRTPLNAIIGFADFLISTRGSTLITETKRDEYLRDILSSGRHLLSIINDILDLARIEAGETGISFKRTNIRSCLKQSLHLTKLAFERKTISIRWMTKPHDLSINADDRILKQVFLNILSNSAKFCPATGGRLRISAYVSHNAHAVVEFLDNGCGIPADQIGNLGKPFFQIGDPRKGETQGTGLGLAICKQLVSQLRGTILIKSEEGKWTRVILRFPIADNAESHAKIGTA